MSAQECLAFRLGERPFLVPVGAVMEVLPAVDVTPLAGARAPVLGAIVRSGRRIPVIDTGGRLGCPTCPRGGLDAYIVVLAAAGREVGLLVDDVDGVVSVEDSALVDPARAGPSLDGVDPALLVGVAPTPRGPALLVDAARVVDVPGGLA